MGISERRACSVSRGRARAAVQTEISGSARRGLLISHRGKKKRSTGHENGRQ